ncbi:alpha-hydroxy-acid oxidizing protein [Ancylobacter dichloromethanicus]|uniref:Alpha-hydroxy-acid oxidizing enzyme n=1 Tax=Ancylobacter dichloromethanicus TaxID=518825 RepID=A0A9W6MZ58_9HYPH|nr:alpha-hydroxy acid oxidase [Ancylobacter dichloromethanicus]MBS7554748.1 alpha-hydroxy-acid oxidizing protein [Ancylobacter dichloromethanicus]GLK72354.1 alpha-hydroxy-acid oxidizing enzyme [Ancylobacter dichloromethanicus]
MSASNHPPAGPVLTARLRREAISVRALRLMARRALPRPVFDFSDGGAEDEHTLRRNEAAFARYALLPRPLDGAPVRDQSQRLFGMDLSMPVMIGPTGLAGLFWPGAEKLAVRAANEAGTAYCASHGSVCTLEDIAATGEPNRLMQLFVYRDRGFTRELAERAAAAGYKALVLTTDNQLHGKRERDLRNGFTIPPRFGAADTLAMATKLPWLMRMGRELPTLTFGNYRREGQPSDIRTLAARMHDMFDPAMTWADVDDLRRLWKGPLILKGVLDPGEAAEAVARGVDGLIVSNHGGRQLDHAVSSIEALPAIVRAVEGRIPVMLDGGVRRGTDVVKALALGASACFIARPYLWALSVGGEAGVAHVLGLFRDEIDRAMGLLGVTSLAQLSPDRLMTLAPLGGTA